MAFVNPSWMPHSVSESARAGDAHRRGSDVRSGMVAPTPGAAEGVRGWCSQMGFRGTRSTWRPDSDTCSACSASASTRAFERSPILSSRAKPSNVDNVYKWGMDCPDCIYAGAPLSGGELYRLWGTRGTARYVGLQSMAGMASSANVLLDELDLGPGGEVDLILSEESHEGNWLPIAENATTLVVRHFFYDWDTEVASSLSIERIGPANERTRRQPEEPRAVVARQLVALGDFVVANLDFFLQFSRPETPNSFPRRSTARRWERRRRTDR